jgi:hypothetical protein
MNPRHAWPHAPPWPELADEAASRKAALWARRERRMWSDVAPVTCSPPPSVPRLPVTSEPSTNICVRGGFAMAAVMGTDRAFFIFMHPEAGTMQLPSRVVAPHLAAGTHLPSRPIPDIIEHTEAYIGTSRWQSTPSPAGCPLHAAPPQPRPATRCCWRRGRTARSRCGPRWTWPHWTRRRRPGRGPRPARARGSTKLWSVRLRVWFRTCEPVQYKSPEYKRVRQTSSSLVLNGVDMDTCTRPLHASGAQVEAAAANGPSSTAASHRGGTGSRSRAGSGLQQRPPAGRA